MFRRNRKILVIQWLLFALLLLVMYLGRSGRIGMTPKNILTAILATGVLSLTLLDRYRQKILLSRDVISSVLLLIALLFLILY